MTVKERLMGEIEAANRVIFNNVFEHGVLTEAQAVEALMVKLPCSRFKAKDLILHVKANQRLCFDAGAGAFELSPEEAVKKVKDEEARVKQILAAKPLEGTPRKEEPPAAASV